ncbi:GIY-YIG nuclease family protein [Glycocaulis profundi]|nr:GIY-YIG nuclease family protein [Glycocaulis profundi]
MRERLFFTYMLASRRNGTLYCGVTNDLVRRTAEHREGAGRSFTLRHAVTRLVWFETHPTALHAIRREKRIKSWPRDWKVALIEGGNPEWRDLWFEIGW